MDNIKENSHLYPQQELAKPVPIPADALLAAIWEGTTDLLAAIDRQFTLTACNKNFRDLFQQITGKVVTDGMNILDVLVTVPGVRIAFQESCKRAFQGETILLHYILHDESQNPHIYETTHYPIFDKHLECIGAVQIFRDVITRVAAEEEVLRLNEWQNQFVNEYTAHMQQINTLQDNFIAVVSHEFRTTLTGIQGFSELLCEEGLSATEIREFAIDINTDSQRLSRIINTLLDLQLMRSGRLTMRQELIDLHALLQETVDRVYPTTSSHTIHLHSDEQLGCCSGDKEMLRQVMSNLLSNAIKYSPLGGDITVCGVREGVILHVTVQDQGRGIPEEALSEIFETYNQISTVRTRHIQGTGLGLALVRQIVQMHGGTVWAESEPGQGATFHVTLPLQLKTPTAPLVDKAATT
jgi:signal transduction histidine kinase